MWRGYSKKAISLEDALRRLSIPTGHTIPQMQRSSQDCIIACYCTVCGLSGLLLSQNNRHFCCGDPDSQVHPAGEDGTKTQPIYSPGVPINECESITARRVYLPMMLAAYNQFRTPVEALLAADPGYRIIRRHTGKVGQPPIIASVVYNIGEVAQVEAWEKLQNDTFDALAAADLLRLTNDQKMTRMDNVYRKWVNESCS